METCNESWWSGTQIQQNEIWNEFESRAKTVCKMGRGPAYGNDALSAIEYYIHPHMGIVYRLSNGHTVESWSVIYVWLHSKKIDRQRFDIDLKPSRRIGLFDISLAFGIYLNIPNMLHVSSSKVPHGHMRVSLNIRSQFRTVLFIYLNSESLASTIVYQPVPISMKHNVNQSQIILPLYLIFIPNCPSVESQNIASWHGQTLYCCTNKLLKNWSSCRWYKSPWCSCDVTVMRNSHVAILKKIDRITTGQHELVAC